MADDFLSDEDKALFRDHVRGVTPLYKQTPRATPACDKKPTLPMPNKKTREPEKHYFLSDFITQPLHSNTLMHYCHPSLPIKRFKALKNGHIKWEARLDLHGLQTEAAREALIDFIKTQTHKKTRCLLIIHGKGGYEGAPPVIKNLVNRWLPQIEEVLAFHSALPQDGGNGAVYVLIKRTKDHLFE